MQPQDDGPVALRALDPDLVRPVDEVARQVVEELFHRFRPGAQRPCAFISLFTESLGCAPFETQSRILSPSRSIVEGLVCGL